MLILFWFNFKILGSKQIHKCVTDKTLMLFLNEFRCLSSSGGEYQKRGPVTKTIYRNMLSLKREFSKFLCHLNANFYHAFDRVFLIGL